MTISQLPLSYCTNVHPGRSLAEVERGLDEFTVPVRQNFGAPLAAGLWLAQPVAAELLDGGESVLARFAEGLARRGLQCHTLNAFPYGDFHSERVKEKVYLPDWTSADRLEYTTRCARILATLLPEGGEGSISTVPLGFKGFAHSLDFEDRSISNLLELAQRLDRLASGTGRTIRLAIEPEPFCVLETTPETLRFFSRLRERAADSGVLEIAERHLGVCYDVCHQAVEYEDIVASIGQLASAGIRINKLHITCALQLDRPDENTEGREALARYVEPRYLHQTVASANTGAGVRSVDLSRALALQPPREFRQAESWRIHFHVPVDAESLGPLSTTRSQVKQALQAVAELKYAPHLEVETYTWEVLPEMRGERSSATLVEGLTRELLATRRLLTV